MSEEDVTISKQTFRLVLYPLGRPAKGGLLTWSFVMPYLFLESFPKVLIIKYAGFPNRSVFRGIGPHADLFDLRGPQKVCIAVQKSTFF